MCRDLCRKIGYKVINTITDGKSAQNTGTGKYYRVKEGVKSAIYADYVISISIIIIAFVFCQQLIGLFAKDASETIVIEVGVEYLRIACLGNVLQGFLHIFGDLLRGTGDLKSFVAAFSSNLISRVIFAYLLYPILGETGIWALA